MPSKRSTKKPADLQYQRTDDFISSYANNAYFESSAWDLKIVFGQLDQPVGKDVVIRQKIAITIPWAQAKLALYFLRLHVEANEVQNGKVSIREDLLPPFPLPLTPQQEKDPSAKQMYDLACRFRIELFGRA